VGSDYMDSYEIYVVQAGDTLFGIASRFDLTIAELQAVNQLPDPNRLVIGQALLIPLPRRSPLRYTVITGDTLFGLAQLFNTTVQVIAAANNLLDPNLIYPGQSLVIPGWSQIPYTVRTGDTLFAIASRFNVTVNQIARVNRLADPSLIFPGQVLNIPQPVAVSPRPAIETLAYFQMYNFPALRRSLEQIAPYITYGALFDFRVTAEGAIPIPSTTRQAVDLLKEFDIRPLAVITNWAGTDTFDPELGRAIIGNPQARANTIQNVLNLLQTYGFAGVNVDFENMYPEDRNLYTEFIRELTATLRPRGFLTTIAMAPKYADFPNLPWVGAFDYAALGQILDFIFIMTYEWGWIGGPPMAIAPITQVRRVLTYATSLIPPTKIIQGIPLYGYNWPLPDTPETLASGVNLVDVYDLAYRYGATIQFDPTAQSPFFRYRDEQGVEHEVWFEDARSVLAKYETAQDFNLWGVGYWSQTNEPYGFPQNWLILEDMFQIIKR